MLHEHKALGCMRKLNAISEPSSHVMAARDHHLFSALLDHATLSRHCQSEAELSAALGWQRRRKEGMSSHGNGEHWLPGSVSEPSDRWVCVMNSRKPRAAERRSLDEVYSQC